MTQFNTNVPPQENSKNAAKLLIHMAGVGVLSLEVSNSGTQGMLFLCLKNQKYLVYLIQTRESLCVVEVHFGKMCRATA
jgi:hypothetical protein